MAFSYFARVDSNSANNPALNLTNAPSVQLSFLPFGGGGDAVLETNGGSTDPDTLVEIGGVSYTFTFEFAGTMPTRKSDGAQQVPDQYEGSTVVLLTVQDYPSPGETTRFAFMPDEDASQSDMDAFGNGAIDVQNLDTTPVATPVCFARGTRITTPDGERRVEDLTAGDMVLTASGKAVEIKWISSTLFTYSQLLSDVSLRPVKIPRDYLGRGKPYQDLWVSQQHRIVFSGWKAELNLGSNEVLIPAKYLMGEPSEVEPRWLHGVGYFHILFETHEVLFSNGLESESFFPGEDALANVGSKARAELRALLDRGSSESPSTFQTSMPTAKSFEAKLLLEDNLPIQSVA